MSKSLFDVVYDEKLKSDDHRFGPDYYAKLASSPSGMKKKLQEMRVPGFPGYDEDIIGDILKENQFPGKIDAPWPPPRSKNEVQDKDIYSAVPVIIYDEVDYKTGPTESPSMTGDYTTSDSDMSFINYYDVEKSQVYKTQKEKSDVNGNIPGEKDKHRETTNSNLENKSVETPTPKPRERPNYVKQQTKTPNTLTNKIEPRELKRAQSESDLLSDSFYTPPRVLTKKKDNTLISKIYSNPHVRSFALSNRNSIPAETGMPTPNFRTQLSVPENILQARYNDKNSLYNSDEGAPMKKQTLYSSAEDLIEANKPGQYQRARSPKFSISSEDDLLSEQSLEHGKLSKSHMFSSYEDLVSAEEYAQIPRKKDNTLISRIYQQQNVRNYALSNRDFIPDNGKSVRKYSESVSSEDIFSDDGSRVKEINKQPAALQRKADTEKRIVIEKENVPISSEEIECETNVVTPDQEINEVARKKIVHNILDQIGNPQQKHKVSRKQVEEYQESNNTDEEITVSVKELRRKFEKEQGTSKVFERFVDAITFMCQVLKNSAEEIQRYYLIIKMF
ncbi:hypothetical protein JTB14_033749 [Gonioctena quinquepunctata]|nr:hypothetical protein JTB14_033749 [Gonioctena quinquepunctata]